MFGKQLLEHFKVIVTVQEYNIPIFWFREKYGKGAHARIFAAVE